jgi:hypothetical protein
VNLTKSMNDCLEKDNFRETVKLSSLGSMWPESAQALGTILLLTKAGIGLCKIV